MKNILITILIAVLAMLYQIFWYALCERNAYDLMRTNATVIAMYVYLKLSEKE